MSVMPAASAAMSREDAAAITDRIRTSAEETWRLLSEAHERGACYALGYPDWPSYVKAEFGMAKSHSYRLLRQAAVIKGIEKVTGSPMGDPLTERETRDLGPQLDRISDTIRERIVDVGEDKLLDIVRGVVAEARQEAADLRMGRPGGRPADMFGRMLGAVDVIKLMPSPIEMAESVILSDERFVDINVAIDWLEAFVDARPQR